MKTKEYTFTQFKREVKKEVVAIKKYAIEEEIDKLNFYRFDGGNKSECIYGQMTGYCRSIRAIELISLCCQQYVERLGILNDFKTIKSNISRNKEVLEKPKEDLVEEMRYYSSLEAYLFLPEAKPENIIDYLKGITKKLEL